MTTRNFAMAALVLTMAAINPALAATSGGGRGGGGPQSPGGGEFEGPVPGVQINCTAAYCDDYPPQINLRKGQIDCDYYLTRVHGSAAKYWDFRYRECKRRIEE